MPKKSNRREENVGMMPIKRAGICSVIGTALYFVEIIAFSAAEMHLMLGAETYLPAGLTAAFISAFIGGFFALIKDKKKALPIGALSGVLQAAISDALLIIINNGAVGKGLVLNAVVSVLGAVIGGVVAANIKTKVKY